MPATLQNQVENLIAETQTPWGSGPLSEGAQLSVSVDDGRVSAEVLLGYPAAASAARLSALLEERIEGLDSGLQATVSISSNIERHAVQGTLSPVDGIKNIIVVSSAKGGVGKSTVSANLALALQHEGARVGVLDADIYGPSQPIMLGVEGEQPVSHDGKTFEPLEALGMPMISIGCLIDPGQPMVWRGPMVTQALNQLLFQTNWKDLDYLIIDMPPGTGDIQLTLGQKVPVSGAIIVTTPQDIALADAVRGLHMFEKVNIPVLGLIENMSSFVCPGCGENTPLFGTGGGAAAAEENNLALLGQLPLDIRIREETDAGRPTVAVDPDSAIAVAFRDTALAAVAKLSQRPKDYKAAFSGIGVTTE